VKVRLGAALGVAFSLGTLAVAARAGDARPKTRTIELTCRATLPRRPLDQPIEVWVSRPLGEAARDCQSVDEPLSVLRVGASALEAKPGSLHATAAPGASFSLTWIARVTRREQRTPPEVLASAASELSAEEKKTLARELESERSNSYDDAFLKRARALAPGETAVVKIARAAYDNVLDTLRYAKTPGTGWGHGSIAWACREGYGNCTDFHALFMNLCRARGIPTRFCMGCLIPPDAKGAIAGYHCWAEFYVPGGSWVPVDASEAWKHPEKRDFYFGNLDADRVLLVRGRDLVLDPPQKGPPVDILFTGHAEAKDGAPVDVECELSYEDVR
jgi:transglutaminase-like putative cysteine protease